MRPLPKLPTSGPCFRRDADGNSQKATYSAIGRSPDEDGPIGVLYWAWDLTEASNAADAYRAHGYKEVRVCNENSPSTRGRVRELIFG